MNKIKELDCNKFKLSDLGTFAYIDLQNRICFKNKANIEGEFLNFDFWNENLWSFNNSTNCTEVYNSHLIEKIYSTSNLIALRVDVYKPNKNFGLGMVVNNQGKKWCFLNPTTFEILKTYPLNYGINGIHKVIDEKRFLSKKDTLITCHSFTDGAELWRVELQKSLLSQLIVVEEKLFFIDEGGMLWCLELSTGQVLSQDFLDKGWLVEHQGLLYSARHNSISIINPQTLTIQTLDCSASMLSAGLEFDWNGFGVEGDYLYFQDNKHHRVGLIHLPTASVAWYTDIQIPEGEYHILETKMKDNRLYVLVQGGNLHIYEREAKDN